MDSPARSIAKTVSYRAFASLITASMVLVITGRLELAAGAGAVDAIVKLAAFYFHERIWNAIPYGKAETVDCPN